MRRAAGMLALASSVIVSSMFASGCGGGKTTKDDPRRAEVDRRVREKWGKSFDELPVVSLVAISPNNRNIEEEFAAAFSLHHAIAHGRRVKVEWRDVGGGSSQILKYLRNIYSRTDSAKIDVVWGGGGPNFMKMAAEGILQPMRIPDDLKANVPAVFGGLEMYDPHSRWCGTAISGFGFLYNKTLLSRLGIAPPAKWDDLGDARFFGLVALGDPTKSGSSAATYEMIVQTGRDWPGGWAKLLRILSNAKKFFDGASGTADAVISETPVATCIDFYGAMRVSKYPDDLVYVSPKGQTAFSPDPIGILKNPPHPKIAQRFVDFVLSRRGQAMWAMPVGANDGPVWHGLYRTPIRKDVFTHYAGKLLGGIAMPFTPANEMKLDLKIRRVRYGLLKYLVAASAIDNLAMLKRARRKLIDSPDAKKLASFNELPENVRTSEALIATARKLKDATAADRIVTGWRNYFREKYRRLAE